MYIDSMAELKNISKFLSSFSHEEFATAHAELSKALGKQLGNGLCREVYDLSDSHVVKVPRYRGSIHDVTHNSMTNILEYMMYKRLKDKIPLAECSIVFYKCVPLIKMEKLELFDRNNNEEYEWIRQNPASPLAKLNDGYQIGRDKNGRVVCYDYGYEGTLFEKYLNPNSLDQSALDLTEEELEVFMKFSPKITGLMEINNRSRNRLIKSLLNIG